MYIDIEHENKKLEPYSRILVFFWILVSSFKKGGAKKTNEFEMVIKINPNTTTESASRNSSDNKAECSNKSVSTFKIAH